MRVLIQAEHIRMRTMAGVLRFNEQEQEGWLI